MTRIRRAAFLLLLAVAAPGLAQQSGAPTTNAEASILSEPPIGAEDPDWVEFYQGEDGSTGAYRQGFTRNGDVLKVEIRARQWESPDGSSEGLFLIELDCGGDRSRLLSGRLTNDRGETQERNDPEDWAPVSDTAPSGALHAKLCPAG